MREAFDAQKRAASPKDSSWVSANAGSGKTRVLTDRVARLLLAGTDPQRILCLTYTKAAAAEMQNRLFATLGGWAMLDDGPLSGKIAELVEPGERIGDDDLGRARTLFARALETPGGLKIQTIHAFCEAVLRRFPLEAGVAPRFEVLEDRQAKALREAVLDELAERQPGVFAGVARFLSNDIDTLLEEIGHHRAEFAGDFDPAALASALGIAPGLTLEALAAETLTPEGVALIGALVPVLEASGPRDREAAAKLSEALAAGEAGVLLDALEAALLTRDGECRAGFPTKAVRNARPDLMPALETLMRKVERARPCRQAIATYARSEALDRFGRAWIAAFGARKRALGLLDFDDMIDRAEALLSDPATAAWVLWRLDGGIDHVLVDEAQDTSPAQWRVIGAISAEFFAGEGARPRTRTLFVVGDEKQSIYSFQGADPAEFGSKRKHYERVLAEIGHELQACELLYSFRSSRPILELVDAVFRGPAGQGLAAGITHHPIDADAPGRVELWPFLPKPEKVEQAPWHLPVEAEAPDDPVEVLARAIAERIAGWLRSGRAIAGRRVRAGDVMILVQRRAAIFHAVIRALKRAGVPVAGADLLRMGGELAVNDLLAALRVAATPGDDLSLAAFLRSPLGGMSEGELFELAHGRGPRRLWDMLREAAPGRWDAGRALLADVIGQADYLRPFELLARMLVRHGGRRRLIARLGTEAEDGIDALLDQALAYEAVEPPTLGGFLAWLDRGELTIKRRSEAGAGQVRVMTVHAAKGLEAPIVILPDTAERRDGANPPQILRLGDGLAAWRMSSDEAPPAIAEADGVRRGLVREENRRLLYVALTRAKHWLTVCGAGVEGTGGSGESWHRLVADAMAGLGAEPGPDGEARVMAHKWDEAVAAPAEAPPAPPPLPAWATAPVRAPAEAAAPLSPSALGGELAMAGEGSGLEPEAAKARGVAVHRLLEHLHGRPAAGRAELAARLLPGRADLAELLAEAVAVLDAPGLGEVFGPGSLAEVELAVEIGGVRLVGRIDRLVVGAGRVLAVDFKSNSLVPDGPGDVPEGILRQLGAYRAGLRRIWPDREVETAVLWTRAGRLMRMPSGLVDAAVARVPTLTGAGALHSLPNDFRSAGGQR